jgi:hypothetical protein
MRSACGLLNPRPTLMIFAAQAHLRRDPGTFDIFPAHTAWQMKAEDAVRVTHHFNRDASSRRGVPGRIPQ